MKLENKDSAATPIKDTDCKKISVVVNGCGVKLNFPLKAEGTAVSDVKRMMLSGVAKT